MKNHCLACLAVALFAGTASADNFALTGIPGAHERRLGSLVVMAEAAASSQYRTSPAGASRPDERMIADTYVYLLARLLMLRDEHGDVVAGKLSYNTIKYEPLGLDSKQGGGDNLAFHAAWIAVDDRIPVIIEIPQMEGRRYTVLIVNEWGDEIVNINSESFPSKPFGRYALIRAGSNGQVPADAARVMLHSGKARMFGVVEIAGEPAEAEKLRRLFRIKTLFKPAIAQKRAARTPKIRTMSNEALIGVEIFDNVEVLFGDTLDVSPNAAAMQEKARSVALYIASSPAARRDVATVVDKVIPEFQAYAKEESGNQDSIWFKGGCNCGSNYWHRATLNYIRGIGGAR